MPPVNNADVIRLYRQGLTLRAMAERLGVAHWTSVQQRVHRLMRRGLLDYGNRSRRPWTAAADAELRGLAGWHTEREIARKLGRSTTAILIRMKRLGLTREWKGAYTARGTGQIFGVDAKTVVIWIERGYLCGARSQVRCGTTRKWRIEHEAIEDFIRDYAVHYERRRITEPFWRRLADQAASSEWVSAKIAAVILGCCDETIKRRIRRGLWPAVQVPCGGGFQWMVRRADLASFGYWKPPIRMIYERGHSGAVGKAS